jgi:hypothetical protein
MGGRPPQSASITWLVGTTRPALSSSNTSSERGFGPPIATGRPSASTSTGPRTRYSISILPTARQPGSQIAESQRTHSPPTAGTGTVTRCRPIVNSPVATGLVTEKRSLD